MDLYLGSQNAASEYGKFLIFLSPPYPGGPPPVVGGHGGGEDASWHIQLIAKPVISHPHPLGVLGKGADLFLWLPP